MGNYMQVASFQSSPPIIEAKNVSGAKDKDGDVYEVRFHGKHQRTSPSAEPGGDRVLGGGFTTRAFAEIKEAMKEVSHKKRVFGFRCEGLYYVADDP
jgi:hypothetical protein